MQFFRGDDEDEDENERNLVMIKGNRNFSNFY
jgi:hypothetical protein